MTDEYDTLMTPLIRNISAPTSIEAVAPTFDSIEPVVDERPFQDLVISAHRQMMRKLCAELLGYIHIQSHGFFEQLVIDVLLTIGYGGRRRDLARRLGRSGDGGVDGIIEMDELGLDMIYIQAKRLKPGTTVAVSAVRDFVGSLDAQHANKGIFVTTAQFSPAAHAVVRAVSKKIVLIDGRRLTELMVRHNIGTVPSSTFQFKTIDLNYFSRAPGKAPSNSASAHPQT